MIAVSRCRARGPRSRAKSGPTAEESGPHSPQSELALHPAWRPQHVTCTTTRTLRRASLAGLRAGLCPPSLCQWGPEQPRAALQHACAGPVPCPSSYKTLTESSSSGGTCRWRDPLTRITSTSGSPARGSASTPCLTRFTSLSRLYISEYTHLNT